MASKTGEARAQEPNDEGTRIVLQVGTDLRITNKGEIIIGNPELELARDDSAADAVLLYKFNPNSGEHSFRLVDPFADRKHTKAHKPGD